MSIGREEELLHVTLHSIDRNSMMRSPRLH
jgi:hypothetical protein